MIAFLIIDVRSSQVRNSEDEANPLWQWSVGPVQAKLMLNTDICLRYNITVNSVGKCVENLFDVFCCFYQSEDSLLKKSKM